MASKEHEAKKLGEEHQEPPPYPGGYGYAPPGQGYGYSVQQGQPPQYGQPQPQYGQSQIQVNQPGAYPQQVVYVTPAPMSNPPPDHLVFNIVMTLCCCWPIGIFAIVKSLECRTAIQSGDRTRAESLSQSAKRLGMWTLGVGIVMVALCIVIMVVAFVVLPNHLTKSEYP